MTNREANRGQQDINRAAPPARVPDVFSAEQFQVHLDDNSWARIGAKTFARTEYQNG